MIWVEMKSHEYFSIKKVCPSSPRHWNTGLFSIGISLTSLGEGVFSLGCHPSSDNVTKNTYGVQGSN